MKKLYLNVANLGATEILSRGELNIVAGGTGSGSGDLTCTRIDGWTEVTISGSPALMGNWAGFWTTAGWGVKCDNGFDNGIHPQVA